MPPKQAQSFASFDTEYTACSLEFCPTNSNIVVCGTYQIVKDAEAEENIDSPKIKRLGRCLLYEASDNERNFRETQKIECSAVLDQRWTQSESPSLLLAHSTGQLSVHQLVTEAGGVRLYHFNTIQCAPPDVLVLSLDISDRRICDGPHRVVASMSNGEVVLFSDATMLRETTRWPAHKFEPWACAFDYWKPDVVWTGGDDCKMKLWDVRAGTASPVAVNKRFDGGVTAIRSHHLREHIFAVGCYDESIHLFDDRYLQIPLSTFSAGGGIWRLKWHPTDAQSLLVAAMHNGFQIVDWTEGFEGEGENVVRFDEHGEGSLAYGVDWGRYGEVIGSCSFYDHKLCFWAR